MVHKLRYVALAVFAALLLGANGVAGLECAARGRIGLLPSHHNDALGNRATVPGEVMAATTITVTSTDDDYTDGKSKKCTDFPPDQCTLRRAINQAYTLSSGQRPVHIVFDIPTSDDGYDSTLRAWKITLTGTTAHDLRELYGKTVVDGSTQPGGRSSGPKIIVDGQGSKSKGLVLRQDDNEVRGLAMQNFRNTHITLSSDGNLVEDCWLGLSDDGMTLSSGSGTDPEGGSGLAISAGSDNNIVRGNVLTGFFGAAAAIRGDHNVFSGNLVGTRANGTVPIPAQFDQHPCLAGAWTGGSGITVADNDNQIGGPRVEEGNVFAGLFLEVGATTTQRPAMDVSGDDHLIQNNVIGLDGNGALVGVCGRGMDFGNAPSDMQVISNTIVETGLSGILMNGSTINGNLLRGNVIRRATAWPGEQGDNNFAEDAIAYGPTVPAPLRNFVPAKVTEFNGTTVSGTSGMGSECPRCTVEVFLDDRDTVTEALQSVAVVTADASGNWNATLSQEPAAGQGLRTMSTVPDTFTIIGLDANTTSGLSGLQVGVRQVLLPLVLRHR
jgi:hypothetical protein